MAILSYFLFYFSWVRLIVFIFNFPGWQSFASLILLFLLFIWSLIFLRLGARKGSLPTPTLQEPPELDPWMCPTPASLCTFPLHCPRHRPAPHPRATANEEEGSHTGISRHPRAGPGWGVPSVENKGNPKSYLVTVLSSQKQVGAAEVAPWTHVSSRGVAGPDTSPGPLGPSR